MESKDVIYGIDELAEFFTVSPKTARKWCKEGKIPAFKIGKEWKVRVSDLHRIINQKVNAKESSERTLF